tara:strand:- start:3528 stop:4487 length:960 start_codon:yes stop_codon:yes gene_type:complete
MTDELQPKATEPSSKTPTPVVPPVAKIPKTTKMLPSSLPLSTSDASEIMGASITRLIVLGGPQNSGKTTLLGSIYEQYQKGSFAGRQLSWCSTLLGFEQVCHEGRINSGRQIPETLRTSRQAGKQMYHLRLQSLQSKKEQDLLLTDVSGEEFEDLRNFGEGIEQLSILRRADHFTILLSGDRIVDLTKRHQAFDETSTVLRVMTEEGLLGSRNNVQIVFSKHDLTEAADKKLKCADFLHSVEEKLTAQFDSAFGSLKFYRISARDPSGQQIEAPGVDALLTDWTDIRRLMSTSVNSGLQNSSLVSGIDQFQCLRTAAQR